MNFSDQITAFTENFMGIVDDNQTFFNRCKDIFKALIPPKGLVDPGLVDIVNKGVQQSREKIFMLFSCCPKVFPAEESAHPVLRYIHDNIVKTAMIIETLEEKQTKVYRTSHLKVSF